MPSAEDRRSCVSRISALVHAPRFHRARAPGGYVIIALAPMLWATGVGHEIISAMAAPVLGGLLIADEVVDIFIPVRFFWVRRGRWLKLHGINEKDADDVVLPPLPTAPAAGLPVDSTAAGVTSAC